MVPFIALAIPVSWLLLSEGIFLGYMKYDAFLAPPYEGVGPHTALVIDLVQYVPFYVIHAYELLKHKIRLSSPTVSVDPASTQKTE